jgi:riboflavin transporter FmnP
MNKSITPLKITSSAVFGALAAIMAVLPLSFPFPILPYLRFDLAEIPVAVAFFLYGPVAGIISSVIYWFILNAVGQFAPIGPALKFLAVISMLMGAWAGVKVVSRLTGAARVLVASMLLGAVVRILVLTLANYVVLWILLPDFLGFAGSSLTASLGLSLDPGLAVLQLALVVTAVYNLLHIPLSMLPSYFIVGKILSRRIGGTLSQPWILGLKSENNTIKVKN